MAFFFHRLTGNRIPHFSLMRSPLWSLKTKDLWYFIFMEHKFFKWLLFPKADDKRELGFWFVFYISSHTQSNTWQDGVAVTQRCLWHLAFSLTLQQLTQPGHKEASQDRMSHHMVLPTPGRRLWAFPRNRLAHLEGTSPDKAQRPSADTRAGAAAATRSWLEAW